MARWSGIDVDVDTSLAEKVIGGVLDNAGDASLALFLMGNVAPRLSRQAKKRFASSGDDASGQWPALAPSTVEIRKSLGFTPGTRKGEINVRTGELQDWLVNPDPSVMYDGVGTTLAWPADQPKSAGLRRKLAQAAGKGRGGKERFVVAFDFDDVAYIQSSLETFLLTGKVVRR